MDASYPGECGWDRGSSLNASDRSWCAPDDHVVAASFGYVGYLVAFFALALCKELVGFGDGLASIAMGTGEFLVDGCAKPD